MSLTYNGTDHSVPGKTSNHSDVVKGQFLELIPDERIVWQVKFESDDPAFANAMTMTWTFVELRAALKSPFFARTYPRRFGRKIMRWA